MAAGPRQLAVATAPLTAAVQAAGVGGMAPVVRVGATLASLGALLALIAGIGRHESGHGSSPRSTRLAGRGAPRHRVPHYAEIALAVVVSIVVATADVHVVIGFSSFGALIYYAIANAAAFTQPHEQRRWPRRVNLLGAAGCLILVATLPWQSVLAGMIMFALGLAGRAIMRARALPAVCVRAAASRPSQMPAVLQHGPSLPPTSSAPSRVCWPFDGPCREVKLLSDYRRDPGQAAQRSSSANGWSTGCAGTGTSTPAGSGRLDRGGCGGPAARRQGPSSNPATTDGITCWLRWPARLAHRDTPLPPPARARPAAPGIGRGRASTPWRRPCCRSCGSSADRCAVGSVDSYCSSGLVVSMRT